MNSILVSLTKDNVSQRHLINSFHNEHPADVKHWANSALRLSCVCACMSTLQRVDVRACSMCVCVCVSAYKCRQTHTHTHTHTCMYKCRQTDTHTHTWTHAHTHSWKPSDSSLFISRTLLAFICHSLSHTQTRTHTRTHTQQTHANLFHKSQKMR